MLTYIITVCMTTALMMAGSCLGEDRKPQMEIDLDGTTNIVPPLTKSLNLTCSLVPAADKDPKYKMDFLYKTDFKTITGVYINLKATDRREEADTAKDAAKITISDPENATLSGLLPRATIMGSSLNEGFIKVGVVAPHIKHAGEYTCKVVGINTAGDHVTLTHKASVQLHKDPEVGNLARYVHKLDLDLEKKNALLEEKVALLEEKVALLEEKDASQDTEIKTKNRNQDTEISNIKIKNQNQDTDISNIKTKNQNQETDIYNIETKNRNQDTEISNIKTKNQNQETDIYNIETKNRNQDTEINKRVSKSDIKQGIRSCSPGKGPNTDTVKVSFPQRYSKAPRVFLSLGRIWARDISDSDSHHDEYYISASAVTQTGFRLRCDVYRYSYIKSMIVRWIAFPSP